MDQGKLFTTTTILGITTTLIHSGVSLAGSSLVIPSIRHLTAAEATSVFTPFYYGGAKVVVPLSAISSLSTIVSSYLSPEKRYQYASAAVLAIVSLPWTAIVMMPTNMRLVEIGKKRGEEKFIGEAAQLLSKWQLLNSFRATAACAAGLVGLATYADLL